MIRHAHKDPEVRPNPELPLFEQNFTKFEQARARNSDPITSHQAASRVTNIGPTKEGILQVLRLYGPSTDERIALCYHGLRAMGKSLPESSPSGLRTRRSWLVERGFVEACGTGKTVSGRNCTVWKIKDGAAYAAGATA